jgi:hypothetical protein
MREIEKPKIRLILSQDSFNTLFTMFTFYVASEAQAGETFYSYNAAKLMNQFVKYGNFQLSKHEKNESDNLYLIFLYEKEVMKIMKMYNKYISVHQKPSKNYYAEFKRDKKSQS